MEINVFTEKLNKVDGNVYVIEEVVNLTNGMYEAPLAHDNLNTETLAVWTGPKLTGERIQSYAISTPSMTPWKRVIRLYADLETAYISYETDGDTVEAEDINKLQENLIRTQNGVNTERDRAGAAEKVLRDNLSEEVFRAKNAEKKITDELTTEVRRAKSKEEELQGALNVEGDRAQKAEQVLTDNLAAEITRAGNAEQSNLNAIIAETDRAEKKETKLQESIQAEAGRAEEAESSIRGTITVNKPIWDDKYTRNEVDNKFSSFETAIDWKEAVNTYSDIAASYPNPEDGWTVNVKDTDYTYRWSGTEWIAISANAIPKATQSVDGLLSKEDKAGYDDAYSKRHIHSNKTVIDKITQAFLDNWSLAYTHIGDAVKHITVEERVNWNTVTNKVDKVSGKGLSANDYTTAEKTKLSGIAVGAKVNVQSDWSVTDTVSDAYLKNKPAALPASDVAAWAKAAEKPSYGWSEITGKPGTFTPASHTHTKSQITDMPAKLSQFTNDSGFITAADVDTSQNHVHNNKTVLDKITQAFLDNWNTVTNKVDKVSGKQLSTNDYTAAEKTKLAGIAAAANNYVHPSSHPGGMITEDSTHRFLTDVCKTISDWNTAVSNGFYMASSAANAPSTAWYFGSVLTHNSNYIYQEIYAFTSSTDAKAIPKYTRCKMNGTWGEWANVTVAKAVPADAKFTDTVYVHPVTTGNKHIPAGGVSGQFLKWSGDGTAVWDADNNTTYSAFKAATPSTAGSTGLVPAPAAGAQAKYLRADGTWQTPPDTNTTYNAATTSAAGLMSAADKAKLDGVASEANKYIHPNGGASAGTYRSVTVNIQGHVTAGTNPTTLAGYGITDAAVKSHNHDSSYLKKGTITWGDLKGGA